MSRWIVIALAYWFAQSGYSSTIMVLGDSLSAAYGLRMEEGWVAKLQRSHPQHTWINVSVSGETTQGGLSRLPALLKQHHPDVIVIELGANDGLRGQPLSHINNNLTQLITVGKSAGANILLLGTRLPPNYGPRYSQGLTDCYTQQANQHNVTVIPFFLEAIAQDIHHFQPDQLHPTAAAQPIIADTIWPVLERVINHSEGNTQ